MIAVLDSGVLSGFLTSAGDHFEGGLKVRQLEADWAAYYGVKHAVSFYSLPAGCSLLLERLALTPVMKPLFRLLS